jgi:hypothetical protein
MGRIKLWRGREETAVIKLLIWQSCFEGAPRPSQRALARKLRVSQPYVFKVMRKAIPEGFQELAKNGPLSMDDLEQARKASTRLREAGMIAPEPQRKVTDDRKVMTTDEAIAEQWRSVNEWKRKNLRQHLIRVPIPR